MPALYCLFESASGYALLEAVETADLSSLKAEVQAAVTDLGRFSKMVKLKAFQVRGSGLSGPASVCAWARGLRWVACAGPSCSWQAPAALA